MAVAVAVVLCREVLLSIPPSSPSIMIPTMQQSHADDIQRKPYTSHGENGHGVLDHGGSQESLDGLEEDADAQSK